MVDDKFIPYSVDEVREVELTPTGGKSASEKMRLFRGRILLKMSSAARAARKEKRMVDSRSVDELVRSFVLAVDAEDERMGDEAEAVMVESDDSGADFWNKLDSTVADRFHGIPIEPE